jgi:uncharacterized protein (TIGR02145 family)
MTRINGWFLKITAVMAVAAGMAFGQTAFTDKRDNQSYKSVKIGGQIWMAQNLNIKTANSWCYDNKESNCKKYGRLYTLEAAKKACPAGWRLSTGEEWDALAKAVGGRSEIKGGDGYDYDEIIWVGAGDKLKAENGWRDGGDGTDDFGFSALPGGSCFTDGGFGGTGFLGIWWATAMDGMGYRFLRGYDGHVHVYGVDVGNGFSVRCVKDD